MTTNRNSKVKSVLAKWLLVAALFVGLFSFAGPVAQSSLQQQKTQTELVFSNNVTAGYRAADYKIRVPVPQSALNRAVVQHNNNIRAYSRLSKVKFDQLSHQPFFAATCCLAHHVKTIPQSSNDDSNAFLIG
jgi:hypothetical protein